MKSSKAKRSTLDLCVAEYPFDQELLKLSKLYRRSRELYLGRGGSFRPAVVSTARTLSSPILLENVIEYSPLSSELEWLSTDPIEKKDRRKAEGLKQFASSLFHEQNHRILWTLLPPAPKLKAGLRRYLNFAEALVITTDMALADELGVKRAQFFHSLGLIYDPGTNIRLTAKKDRVYRNYLQACLHATYLRLELFEPELIGNATYSLYYQFLESNLLSRATRRAIALNPGFVTQTNLIWQRKHFKRALEVLSVSRGAPLDLTDDPLDNVQQYLLAEKWFDLLG